ncbi:MAG: methyltransferase family protein, partial [Gemmatimonadaceae bacterium]
FTLGRNWSGTVTVKENHELIVRGPYRIVRHPIYTGFTLGMLGTALVIAQVRGLIAMALIVCAWRLKWGVEERFMLEEFGERYADYKKRVSALIPGIW